MAYRQGRAVRSRSGWGRYMRQQSSTSVTTRNMLLLLLACAAGAVDAVSYMELGRVFTANMTGNTVLLGLALVQAESAAAVRSAFALVGFLVGSALGAWIVDREHVGGAWPPTVTVALGLEWLMLIVFAVSWQFVNSVVPASGASATLVALSALAMGVQSAAARRLDVSGVATTYITGTLTSFATRLMGWLSFTIARLNSPLPTRPTHGAGLLAAVWLVYFGGAMVAGAATLLDRALAVVFPIALVMIVIVTAMVHFRTR